jgi:serine/threonine protein kinase
MSNTAPQPDDSKLRRLLQGELPAEEEATVLALVEREPAWQAALDAQAADDATWRAATASLRQPPLAIDAALKQAIEQANREFREQSAIHTPTGLETVESGSGGASAPVDLSFLAKSDDPQYLGRLGAYLIESVIGRGGFGVVLKARDPKLARIVAVKVLAPHLAASGTACQRFLREARGAAAVVHEHVITIHDVVEDHPLPHLVMQYVAGQSLQEKLDKGGPLDLQAVLRIGMQTAAGLAAAHKQGLVHRDIKPANILLENGIERVKITDFGLARAADDASLTRSGVVAGTPQYMSPEQARGASVDARSDLFSLGSVLYAMCAGRPPFRADSTLAVLKRVCEDQARPIRELNPAVPAWLASIIDRLMAKDPARRLSSAQEVADLLGKCLLHVQQPNANPLPPEVTEMAVVAEVVTTSAGVPPVRPAELRPEDLVPPVVASPSGETGMLAAKPTKFDPLAHAPDAPPAHRARRGLLGCLLIVGGLMLASCLGVFWIAYGLPTKYRNSTYLVVKMPDDRLSADLKLERLSAGYLPGEALQSLHSKLEVSPGSRYRLAPGDYRLLVKSDEVVVHSELVHLSELNVDRTVEVPEAGILHIDFQPRPEMLRLTLDGEECISTTSQSSKRMLVVPAGTLRVKTTWGNHVYAERLVEIKAQEEKTLKITSHDIEEAAVAPGSR